MAGAALLAGGGLAAGLPAMAAVGQSSPPSSPVVLGKTAQLQYRGVVAVPYAYVACTPGDYAYLSISLTERTGKTVTSGYGSQQINCSGQIQTIRIPVTPPSGSHVFVKGTGVGQAQLQDCGYEGCNQTTVTGKVAIR